jgi:hypothetical protein
MLMQSVSAQYIDGVHTRDDGVDFTLKKMDVQTRVLGPIVRNRTVYTYDNPFKTLTEAVVDFTLDDAAVLGGFAYWYKSEYVPGILMDKNKAWFIYTAITSRDKDPGIMEQESATTYHAQIYPLAIGHDFRLELLSIGFLEPGDLGLVIPTPETQAEIPFGRRFYRVDESALLNKKVIPDGFPMKQYAVHMHAQRFKDRKYYVAGIVRGVEEEKPKIKGLRGLYMMPAKDGKSYNFVGWMRRPGDVKIEKANFTKTMKVHGYDKGTDTAKLWAHQRLIQGPDIKRRSEALRFSMKYGVPSTTTALLAVPKQEMKLFKKKEAEFNRKRREMARRDREWEGSKPQNWQNSGGGDPEIRAHFPNAERAYAILPDGRVLDLKPTSNGYWAGSYDIPTTAGEGAYNVKVIAVDRDGTTSETLVPYFVDRTAPEGTVSARVSQGRLVIMVRSEKDLADVRALLPGGKQVKLEESEKEPGLYSVSIVAPRETDAIKVVLLDKAHNRRELRCSW